jgi:hypothetical protein
MEDDEMIQREVAEAKVTFRQVIVPDGVGGHTAHFIIETREHTFNVHAARELFKSGKYC